MRGDITKKVLRTLDRAAALLGRGTARAPHLTTGVRGEEEAYFHLRQLGYVMVARNFRSPRRKGEVDLIGWEGDTLCFVEVKTRRSLNFIPAEAAVDRDKQRELRIMAREYAHRLKQPPAYRFDVISVYLEGAAPQFRLIRNAFAAR